MTSDVRVDVMCEFIDVDVDENFIMVCIDFVVRGLDFGCVKVDYVVNFDFFMNLFDYIYRFGRIVRAGVGGKVINFVVKKDCVFVSEIDNVVKFGLLIDNVMSLCVVSEVCKKKFIVDVRDRRIGGRFRVKSSIVRDFKFFNCGCCGVVWFIMDDIKIKFFN